MSEKNLRRKGQGETQRPICTNQSCINYQQDLLRSYVRKNEKFKANGWECDECKMKLWDSKNE